VPSNGAAKSFGQLFSGNCTGPQKPGLSWISQIDDGRFEADTRGATIQNVAELCSESAANVLGRGGADITEGIGARCCKGPADELEQSAEQRVRWDADGNAWQAGGYDRWDNL
jgi:hypothetical protein